LSYLLDTNVVSEPMKPAPDAGVVAWLADADEANLYLSAVSFAELHRGVERMASGHRRDRLDAWLQEDLAERFAGRILPVDLVVADQWGRIVVQRERRGRPIGHMDALIAATARVHSLTLVTRNAADFEFVVEKVLNPWAVA
jgi:hypothetical protein